MTQTRSFTRLLCALFALGLCAVPVSAFVIGNSEDLEALTPAPENSEPVSANYAPIAQNLEFTTYRNVTIIESLSAIDPEGDPVSYRIVKNPARGSLTLSEDGTASFTYSPYENKKGKDSFTYVAVDSLGNTSAPATVKIRIQRAQTQVTYADMNGNPAHKAAVRLAELDVLVGQKLGGNYLFRPDDVISREEFLTLAMRTLGEEDLFEAASTGFADDASIAVWAKGSVASALHGGMVTGSVTEGGQTVFAPLDTISFGEASILVNRLLKLTDVAAQDTGALPSWLAQPVANLAAVGVVAETQGMEQPLTRGDCAVMLSNALDVLDFRAEQGKFFPFW